MSHDSGDFALRAVDEARELFYAANLASTATSEPLNAAPLLRRSLIQLLSAMAASSGVDDRERARVVAAALEIEDREHWLDFPVSECLDVLDAMDARTAIPRSSAEAAEAAMVARLTDAMPRMLRSVRARLEGRRPERPALLGRRARFWLAGVVVVLAAAAGVSKFARQRAESKKGLRGVYFADTTFTRRAFERRDQKIDFTWNEGAPDATLPADGFCARWEGSLLVPENGDYTFYLYSDDGSRLYIGGRLVLDNWGNHSAVEDDEVVKLEAGKVPIRVDYFESSGNAAVRLSWSSNAIAKSVVPAENLGH